MSAEKPTSIWKKELSFKRKPAAAGVDPESAREDAGEATSVWKKEISLRRKPKPAAAAVPSADGAPEQNAQQGVPAPPEPPSPASPVPPAPVSVDQSWLTQPLEEVSVAGEAPTLELLAPAPPPLSAPPALAAVPPVDAILPGELDPAFTTPEPPLAPPVAVPPLSVEPAPLGLAPLLDGFELPAELVEAANAVLAAAAAPAPAPASEPASEPAAEAKQPFYRRELSFGRGAKKEPKPEREPSDWDEADVRKPFCKRELTLRRRRTVVESVEAAAAAPAPKAGPARERPKLRRIAVPRPAVSMGKNAKSVVGLKIGSSQIAAAWIVNGSQPELVQAVREELEPGIVVGGELRDPGALAVALKAFFRRNRLPRRGVRLGIANNRIGVRTFEVVGIDDPKQLANAIRFRAQEVLPIPIEEAVLDYHVLSESRGEDGAVTRRVLLVVAYRELVDRYVNACRRAGIQIVGIDLEAFALLRALAVPRDAAPGDDQGALVAVAVGHDRSTFAVSDGRNCEFTRVLEWGGWALNVAIARALDLAPSEAEPVKRALSLAGVEELPAGFDETRLETAREAARRQLQAFARELVSSLQFYQNQPGSLGIAEIVLTGGTTHLLGFASELERLIGVPVRVGDPLARVKVSKRVRQTEQTGSLAIAIGLGIED